MEFYNKYPYTDFHEMNLDWLIHQVKATDKKVDDFTALNKLTWAGDWDIGKYYTQWSLVNDLEGNGYVAIVPVPRNIEITNTEYWKPVIKYDAIYGAFEARIEALEADNITNKADIVELKSKSRTVSDIIDLIYPIGSFYITENDTIDPNVQFPGTTWKILEGRFLLGNGHANANANTSNFFGPMSGVDYQFPTKVFGGQDSHSLTAAENGKHSHKLLKYDQGDNITVTAKAYGAFGQYSVNPAQLIEESGEGQAHNNMPPFYTVRMFRRTA